MATRIKLRRDTSTNWTSSNPILAQGEVGIELDSNNIKIGNGTTNWNSLQYFLTGIVWKIVSSHTNIEKNVGYLVDCSVSSITLTLPASPELGDTVYVKNYKSTGSDFNIVIDRNGQKFEGTTSNFVISANKHGAQFVFSDAEIGWVRVYETHGPAIYS